jgi:hypothetical protein
LDVTKGVLIDLDNNVTKVDKMHVGDVEIPCPAEVQTAECAAEIKEITCKKDGSGYSAIVTVTNNSGQTITSVLLTPPPGSDYTLTPQNPPLPGGSLANHASANLPITINGGKPGEKACFTVTFMTKDGCQCTIEVCTVLPDCCVTLNNDTIHITCNKDGTYTLTAAITNNSGSAVQFIYLYPPAGMNVTITPDHFTMPSGGLAAGAVFQTPSIIIAFQGGKRPQEFCFDISMHTKAMENCCTSPHHCIALPDCKDTGPLPSTR